MSEEPNPFVVLLHRWNRSALEGLRARHGDSSLFHVGVVLGSETSTDPSETSIAGSATASAKERLARRDLALVALQTGIEQAATTLPKARARLRRIAAYELLGQFAGVIGSATVLAQLLRAEKADVQIQACAAGIALCGTLLALAISALRKDLSGSEGGLAKNYTALREAAWRARELAGQLKHPELTLSITDALISEAETVARELMRTADEAA